VNKEIIWIVFKLSFSGQKMARMCHIFKLWHSHFWEGGKYHFPDLRVRRLTLSGGIMTYILDHRSDTVKGRVSVLKAVWSQLLV